MSFTTITIKERKDPLSYASKYIIRKLGINIRTGEYVFDEIQRNYTINLNAIIPNEISPMNKSKKSIYFIFKNIGEITLNEDCKIIDATYAHVIEDRILKEFWKIHQRIEETIKEYGKKVWGRMTYFKWFLNPLFAIINDILVEQDLTKSEYKKKDYFKYIIPFIKNNLIEEDPHNPDKLICTNYLKALIDENKDLITTAEIAIGIIINNSLDYLINELNITGFLPYIDLPKIYYMNALEYGELIDISYREIINKYQQFSRSSYMTFKKKINRKLMLSELINANLLKKHPHTNSITGVEHLFNKIIDFRDEILSNKSILIEG